MTPHFICIGSQKAGTEWIYTMFGSHEAFWKHPVKELHFFDKNFGNARFKEADRKLKRAMKEHGRGKKDFTFEIAFLLRMLNHPAKARKHDFSAYYSLFENKPGLCFDCTPSYVCVSGEMAQRIYDEMPGTRFILSLRDPISRLWSQAQMHERLGRNKELDLSDQRMFVDFARSASVLRRSFLAEQVSTWRTIDLQGRLKILFFDDLVADPDAYRKNLSDFLEVDPTGFSVDASENRKANQQGKRPIPEEHKIWASFHFREEYAKISALLGGHATRWHEENEDRIRNAGGVAPDPAAREDDRALARP